MRLVLSAMSMLVAGAINAQEQAAGTKPEKISLWSGRAPIGDGKFAEADAFITVHRPAG
jgi:hypothetical protein